MTGPDLLFILSALASVVTVVVAAALTMSGGRGKAGRLIRALGFFVIGYLGVSMTVAFLKPQQVLAVENPWCFDDWCLAVDHMTEQPTEDGVQYTLDLRIVSRARRVSQRANGAWIYVLDQQGQRFAPTPVPNEVPLDVLLQPGETRRTTRTFVLPPGRRPVGLVTGHGGGYCGLMNMLIVGHAGCLFGKPTMIGLVH